MRKLQNILKHLEQYALKGQNDAEKPKHRYIIVRVFFMLDLQLEISVIEN